MVVLGSGRYSEKKRTGLETNLSQTFPTYPQHIGDFTLNILSITGSFFNGHLHKCRSEQT